MQISVARTRAARDASRPTPSVLVPAAACLLNLFVQLGFAFRLQRIESLAHRLGVPKAQKTNQSRQGSAKLFLSLVAFPRRPSMARLDYLISHDGLDSAARHERRRQWQF
jgi:hypothetical protein